MFNDSTEQIKLLTVRKQDFANASHMKDLSISKQMEWLCICIWCKLSAEKNAESCPNARRIGEAVLYNHKFIIDERGNDGDVLGKKRRRIEVRGIAWLVPDNEIRYGLDKAEGVNMTPPAYKKQMMKIHILGTNNFNYEALFTFHAEKKVFMQEITISKILEGLKENSCRI